MANTATNTKETAKIIEVGELKQIRYPLPESWKRAAGLLKGKKVNALGYQRIIRTDWEKRLKKLGGRFRVPTK